MKAVHQLIAYFHERGQLSAEQLAGLVKKGYWSEYTARDLKSLERRVGQSFFFQVTGDEQGPLWGTDTYTSDSNLGTASVHAGVLEPGQSGVVKVTIVLPMSSFHGSQRNGVVSQNWHTPWSAYQVEEAVQ